MRIETIPISEIKPAAYNPRKDLQPGDAEYERITRSVDEFGLVEPLVWNQRTGNLVGGHQRLKVLAARGAREVEVSVVDLPPQREKALNIALNKVAGEWDDQKLAELLDDLCEVPDFDVTLTGFEREEVDELVGRFGDGIGEDDFDIEAELARRTPPVTRKGELIELGAHRLLCGDCTNPDDVRRVMNSERAILMATDPPYQVGYDGLNHPTKKSESIRRSGRNKDWSEAYGRDWDENSASDELYDGFIGAAIEHALTKNAAFYIWHASRRQVMLESVLERHGVLVHMQLIWAKDRPVLTRSWYLWGHEPCLMGWRSPHKPPRRSKKHLPSVWQVPSVAPGTKTEHPTSKPLRLFEIPMQQHTRRGEAVYEPFAGSGSQLIAAERLGRRCFSLEISPRFCDLIVRRYIGAVGRDRVPEELAARYAAPAPAEEARP